MRYPARALRTLGVQAGLWLPPLLVGAGLRGCHLPDQILTGDELHAVNGALSLTVGEILRTWTYHGADYSVPLTAFYRFLLDRGVVLSELGFRLPVLAASLATILLVPRLLLPRIGRRSAVVLAWLLALSPMLVLYGRMVRSYAPTVLLACGAVIAFDRWWRGGSRRAAGVYVGLAAGASWLHLGAAPFVLSPFLFATVRFLADGSKQRRRLAGTAALAGATAGAIALLLLPAAESLFALAELHGRGRFPPLASWREVAFLQLGTHSTPLLLLLVAIALRGGFVLARREREFLLLLGTLLIGQVAGLVVLAPNFLEAPIVLNRYLLVGLPFLLLLVAVGLATPLPESRAGGLPPAQLIVTLGLLGWLFGSGPLADEEFRWSSFTHAQPFVNFRQQEEHALRVPAFYRELPPGEEAILEAPWTNVGTHSFSAYQRVHRRPLRMVTLNRLHQDPRVRFRNILFPDSDSLLGSDARWIVVHVDVRQEELRIVTPELRHLERLESLPELWEILRGAGLRLAARLQTEWGPAVHSDEEIRVWDLHAVRSRSSDPDP
ncbi:MAG: hypothetical protein ABFS46_01830 [Myxococcota bacterium]